MGRARNRSGIFSLIAEIVEFMSVHKTWWLLPPIIALLLLASLFVIAQSSALAPFIYTLF